MQTRHVALTAFVLGAVALPSAAFAQETCGALFTRSAALSPLVVEAYEAMHAKKAEAYAQLLPKLEKELNAITASEVKAEVCDGNHVNAYTAKQFTELTFLEKRGLATGFAAGLPIVKQPDLSQASLAYSVGWIKYEQSNFEGALAAYNKGLTMFPNDVALQQEKLATLMQLKRYDDVVAYCEVILTDGTVMDDVTRGKTYSAYGLAKWLLGDLAAADSMMTVSLKYNNITDTVDLQKNIRDAMAEKN